MYVVKQFDRYAKKDDYEATEWVSRPADATKFATEEEAKAVAVKFLEGEVVEIGERDSGKK